jgi:glyoxylase-like metal-dependent hydrolase (beta-lactamase superfamily II)
VRLIDVEHLGRPRVIACFELDGVLVDPGPESSLGTLLDRLTERPKAILLTHIHLDHAGATGALVERWPDLVVHVHARGAPHLIDPTKLLASAERLYGDEMERLWGRIVPVPADRVRVLEGGERIGDFDVAATPGHASHHVCYLHRPTRLALVGDTGGVRTPPSPLVTAPTPPPEIDVEAWRDSLERIRAWRPSSLAITHFGIVEDPARHLDLLRSRLDELAERARTADAETFVERLRTEIEAEADAGTAAATIQAIPPLQQYLGLERYWRKRAERASGGAQTAK